MMDGPSHSSNNFDKNNGKAGNGIDVHSGRANVQMKENARKGSRIHSNYATATKHPKIQAQNTNTNAHTMPSGKQDIQTQTFRSGTKQVLLTRTQFKEQTDSQFQYNKPPLFL